MSKRILVSVSNNLITDQRVKKVCDSLTKNGHSVTLIGSTLGGKKELSGRAYPYKLIPVSQHSGFIFYAVFNFKLALLLLQQRNSFDVFWSNDLDTLVPNYILGRLFGKKIVCDSHEIFSELPSLQSKKIRKKVWKTIEQLLLKRCDAVITVSHGYASWFYKKYGIEPTVIRNVPLKSVYQNIAIKTEGLLDEKNVKRVIYQGALNPSRGLSHLLKAARLLADHNIVFWIIGTGPYEARLKQQAKELEVMNKNVFFMGSKTPTELREITPSAHIGLSIEENGGISYKYALPNKLFDYIHSGIPVLASYLPEIKETVLHHKVGLCIENHNPKEIKAKILELLKTPKSKFKAPLAQTAEKFCWENEEYKLIQLADQL